MTGGRTYGGRTAAERAAARRAAFLEAGLELYGRNPYDDVGVADLVAESGQTRRAFYELFADRDDLLRQVDEQTRDGILATVLETVTADPSWDETQRILRAIFAFYRQDPRRIRVAFVAVVGRSDALEEHRRRTFRVFAEAFGAVLGERAGPDPAARRRALQAFVGAFSELFVDAVWSGDEDLDAVEGELLALFRARFYPRA